VDDWIQRPTKVVRFIQYARSRGAICRAVERLGGRRKRSRARVVTAIAEPEQRALSQLDRVILDPRDPYGMALAFMKSRYTTVTPRGNPQRTLAFYRGEFLQWVGSHWTSLPRVEAKADVYDFIRYRCVGHDGAQAKATRTAVANVLDALEAAAIVYAHLHQPSWLGVDNPPAPAAELIAFSNGLLHIPTRTLHPCDSAYFNGNALPFAYDADAVPPAAWLSFLNSLWADDAESIRCLRQWFGYVLSGDRLHHKMMLIVGPKRSGKGTVAHVQRALVGEDNFAAPTLASLGMQFGLQPLIGRTLACISDARLSGRTDTAVVTENLLRISAGDPVDVPRKFAVDWSGVLGTRFLLLSNELPRLSDHSGALASRFLIVQTTQSFLGREDKGLLLRLLRELPGIVNWSLDGLDDLNEVGWFTEPESTRDAVQEMEDLGSPIAAFVRDCCIVEPGTWVPTGELFESWRSWCREQGRESFVGDIAGFGRNLRAHSPHIVRDRVSQSGDRERVYRGIRMRRLSDASDEYRRATNGE
jgi:putative DNA primase/helicase